MNNPTPSPVADYQLGWDAAKEAYEKDIASLKAEIDQARCTAEYWKAEHLAGNAVIRLVASLDAPWPLTVVLEKLIEIAEIAARVADYPGKNSIIIGVECGKGCLRNLRAALECTPPTERGICSEHGEWTRKSGSGCPGCNGEVVKQSEEEPDA